MNNQVDQILKQAEAINQAIEKHNIENQKQEGFREATKKRLVEQLEEYNRLFGTSLTLEDTEGIQKEYEKAFMEIVTESKKMQEVLKAVQENDIQKVSQLTGIDIEQDTIKVPAINVDMDEMERQAEKAFKEVVDNNTIVQQTTGFGVPANQPQPQLQPSDVQETIVETVAEEDEEEPAPSEPVFRPDIRSFFDGKKVAPESQAGTQQAQTEQNTIPNFSNIFGGGQASQGGGNGQPQSQPQPQQKPAGLPDFSNMFKKNQQQEGQAQQPTQEPVKEPENISAFLSGFKFQGETKNEGKNDAKVEEALKNQSIPVPQFNFGSIDVDDEE
jgi:uncharacterized protein YecA (UPF0149 family)